MLALLALVPIGAHVHVTPCHRTPPAARAPAAVLSAIDCPKALLEAPWVGAFESSGESSESPELRMGEVLTWLSTMLVKLDLVEDDDDMDDGLDENFVQTARPWLHTKEFFSVSGAGAVQSLWSHAVGAPFLQQGGDGGAMLLLLPAGLPLPLFDSVVASVDEVLRASLNAELRVSGCHPDSHQPSARSPVPLIQLFLDNEDLLVDGGSLGDASAFL